MQKTPPTRILQSFASNFSPPNKFELGLFRSSFKTAPKKNQAYQKKLWQPNCKKPSLIGEKTGFSGDKPGFSKSMTIKFEKPGF